MKLPVAFRAAGIAVGIKSQEALDLGLITAEVPLYWALTSTRNQVVAPCVSRNRARYSSGRTVHGVIVNSGNANCANGDQGIWDNEDFAGMAASALGLPQVQNMLTASTGIIGHRLPVARIRSGLSDLAEQLGDDSEDFAKAILTTDTCRKQVAVTLRSGARILGIAKGSGMIHPNMATMLAFVMTDASISQTALRELWPSLVERSFNQITVDGDTSPNDMALLLSSHQHNSDPGEFAEALDAVCRQLAEKIAGDGEGATKLLVVEVKGGRSGEGARAAARQVARSLLVKTAMHGNDPNWGRILTALGSSGAILDQSKVTIRLQDVLVYQGAPKEFEATELAAALDRDRVTIAIDLAAGEYTGSAWGCDLTADYVRINADYHT